MITDLYKQGKVTLFLIENEMVENILKQYKESVGYQKNGVGGERRHNFKKVHIGLNTIHAIFIDYQNPTFRDLQDAK